MHLGHSWAKRGHIRNIYISMKSGENTILVLAHYITRAHKLACIHVVFLHEQAHILAEFGQIREIKVSMELGENI